MNPPSERLGDAIGDLALHDLEHALHGDGRVLGAQQAAFAFRHHSANGETHVLASFEKLLAVVKEFFG